MLTTYAKQHLALYGSLAFIALTAPALKLSFYLLDLGLGYGVFILPGLSFLLGGLLAMKAESLEPDTLPPCLTHLQTRKTP